MNWGGLVEFFRMGGYGFYVWSSYGMCAALIAAELWSARARRRRAVAEAERAVAREAAV
jgi:heme exporter protein D